MAKEKKGTRGVSYPVINLEKAVGMIEKMLKAVGKAGASSLQVAQAAGYGSVNGKSRRVIAALGQYNLLEKRASDYRLSSLALDILFPESEQAKKEAIAFAATSPTLFNSLVSVYEGDQIPGLLPNILVSRYGINPKFGKEVAKIFKETLEFSGVLRDNGTIVSSLESQPHDSPQEVNEHIGTAERDTKAPAQHSVSSVTRTMPSGIAIAFPERFDYHVLTGDFAEAIKLIEQVARTIDEEKNNGKS